MSEQTKTEDLKKEVAIVYEKNNVSLRYQISPEPGFNEKATTEEVVRYLKGIFTNRERFISRFINELKGVKQQVTEERDSGLLDPFDYVNPDDFECTALMDELIEIYDRVEPFTYREAFELEDQSFQAKVFGSINITDMIKELGHERLKVEGKAVKHKQFDSEGNFIGYKEYDNIYETHRVSGKKLGLEDDLFAVKCWCTTTNKEHWLWIEDQFKDSPLEAIASTFRVHENVLPHIKELKRQGDVLLVEMNKEVEPEGEMIALNADQYFGLLTAQS